MNIYIKIAYVQGYIHFMKNVEVVILPPATSEQLIKLDIAFDTASRFFERLGATNLFINE